MVELIELYKPIFKANFKVPKLLLNRLILIPAPSTNALTEYRRDAIVS